MARTVTAPRPVGMGRTGHCGTRSCRCTHLDIDPLFPEAPACDRGFRPAPPGATSSRGVPVGPDAVIRCPVCQEAALLAAS
jgi:hypothetical protein